MVVLEDAKVAALKLVFMVAKKVVLHLAKTPAYTRHQASPLTNRLQTTTNPVVMIVLVDAKIVAVLDAETHVVEIAEPIVRENAKPIVQMIVLLHVKEIVLIIVAVNVPMMLARGNVYQHAKTNVFLVVTIDVTSHVKPHV